MNNPRNDGRKGLKYDIDPRREALSRYVTNIVNEAWHIHRYHPEVWKREFSWKDIFAARLARLFVRGRSLVRMCLDQRDRVLSMLVYRALELIDCGANLAELANGEGSVLDDEYDAVKGVIHTDAR